MKWVNLLHVGAFWEASSSADLLDNDQIRTNYCGVNYTAKEINGRKQWID